MSRIIDVTDETFEAEVLKASTPVMLDLWGDWCEPCKALEPVVRKIAQTYAGKLKVCRMDVGANPRTATACRVGTLPTLLFFKSGEVVGQHVGVARSNDLNNKIEDHLQVVMR
jgi:thioredoxin 1